MTAPNPNTYNGYAATSWFPVPALHRFSGSPGASVSTSNGSSSHTSFCDVPFEAPDLKAKIIHVRPRISPPPYISNQHFSQSQRPWFARVSNLICSASWVAFQVKNRIFFYLHLLCLVENLILLILNSFSGCANWRWRNCCSCYCISISICTHHFLSLEILNLFHKLWLIVPQNLIC